MVESPHDHRYEYLPVLELKLVFGYHRTEHGEYVAIDSLDRAVGPRSIGWCDMMGDTSALGKGGKQLINEMPPSVCDQCVWIPIMAGPV